MEAPKELSLGEMPGVGSAGAAVSLQGLLGEEGKRCWGLRARSPGSWHSSKPSKTLPEAAPRLARRKGVFTDLLLFFYDEK